MSDDLHETMLSAVYKALIRHTHPDKASAADRKRNTLLTQRINAAYAAKDLDGLQAIFREVMGMTGDPEKAPPPPPPPRREHEPTATPPDQKERSADTGVGWEEVGKVVGKAIAAFLDARQARRAMDTPSLNGAWRTPDGFLAHITQRRNKVTLQIANPYGALVSFGVGNMKGDRVELQLRQFNGYNFEQARAMLQVSPDGRRLGGTLQTNRTGVMSVLLERQW
jgi:hypothetical protein